jgi:hypothetical protein
LSRSETNPRKKNPRSAFGRVRPLARLRSDLSPPAVPRSSPLLARRERGRRLSAALLAFVFLAAVAFGAAVALSPGQALAQDAADEACKAWYEKSPHDEQAREDLEMQAGEDQDKDGCTGMVAAPGSNGPAEDAPLDPTNDPEAQKKFEEGQDDPAGSGTPEKSADDCASEFKRDNPAEQDRERQDQEYGIDNDGDGCVGQIPDDQATSPDGQSIEGPPSGDPVPEASYDPGGFNGLALGAFQTVLGWLYGVTVEKPSEELSRVITEEAFQMPDLDANGIGGFYEKFSDAVKPGAVLVMLYVGYLMMFQGASYNANVTVQNVLPKIFIFFAMIGFLPQLVGMLNDLTEGLSKTFVSQGTVETFLSGHGSAAHSAVEQGFLAVIAQAASFVMMLLVVFVCGIKNIVQTQLYVLSPLAMLLWAVPGLSSIAAAWARAMVACIALPLVFAVEFAIGAVMINNPGSVFGQGLGNDSVIGSVIVTVVVLYVVWRTPKHMLAWSLTGYSASPGVVATMTRTLVTRAIPVPSPA